MRFAPCLHRSLDFKFEVDFEFKVSTDFKIEVQTSNLKSPDFKFEVNLKSGDFKFEVHRPRKANGFKFEPTAKLKAEKCDSCALQI